MNRKLLATAVAGVIAPMAAQALDVSVSGHVNRAIRFADNGVNSDVQHVDGSASKSRFRFEAEGEVMPGITAGAHIEYGAASNAGGGLDVEAKDNAATFDARGSYLYFSGDFGKITLGNAVAAGNGVMWKSHSGAWMGTEYSLDTNSGISVMTTDDMKAVCDMEEVTSPTHGVDGGHTSMGPVYCAAATFFPSANIGRKNTLRYDTPSIGPVSFSASVQKDGATDHQWSFGADLSHDVGAVNVIGGMILMDDVLGIAGGLAFPNGTSVNAAWGTGDGVAKDFEDMYINVAHTMGNLSVAVDYRSTQHGMMDMEGRKIGLGAQYAMGGGVHVYAGFNNFSFDDDGMKEFEDINAFHVGSRVKFN